MSGMETPVLRPSQRLRAVALAGGPVTVDQTFVEALLKEVRALEGNFESVTGKRKGTIANAAVVASQAALRDAEARLISAQAALRRAQWHLALSVGICAPTLALLLWGL